MLTTFTVTNTNDSGDGSLRQAILDVNNDTGETSDVIAFSIGGAGAQTIQPLSPLPAINNPVTIDGETQPGYAGSPLIVLDGSEAGTGSTANGLVLYGDDSSVFGLAINQFASNGIAIYSNGDTIQGDYIGTDATGTTALGNDIGVYAFDCINVLVGGTTTSERNVISGNGTGVGSLNAAVAISGNYIGTDASGETALGNKDGISVGGSSPAGGNTIGGSTSGSGNLVSGNQYGVALESNGNLVEGNLIGTDASGQTALTNTELNIAVDGANNVIGGLNAAERNVIVGGGPSGNVEVSGNGNVMQGNYLGTDVNGIPLGIAMPFDVYVTGSNNTIGGTAPGAGNLIKDAQLAGIALASGTGNAIRGNSVFGNGAAGILYRISFPIDPYDHAALAGYAPYIAPNHLDGSGTGPNNLENYPVLASATPVTTGGTEVTGTLNSTPNSTIAIDFFANDALGVTGHGQGQTYLGTISVTTDSNGNASIDAVVPGTASAGQFVSATATDQNGNTSEFSLDVPVFNAGQTPSVGALLAQETETIIASAPTFQDTVFVWNTNDSGAGSLRQAINEANAFPGDCTIDFDIGGGGAQTIQPLSPLPAIWNPVTIDGETQPGYSGSPLIVLDGSQAGMGSSAIGLTLNAGDSTVRGLVVNQFNSVGIACYFNSGYTIQGCYIGTDATGTIAEGNGGNGIQLAYVAGGLVGGTDPADRNVISGNNDNADASGILAQNAAVTIEGNYIGTDVTGEHALGNTIGIFLGSGSNLVGGTAPGAGNLISGNGMGIRSDSTDGSNNVVQGNLIGTDASGTLPLGNAVGVYIAGSGNTVGGTTPAARNVISASTTSPLTGYSGAGVLFNSAYSTDNVIAGNFIGTDISGTKPLGNRDVGIGIDAGSGNTIGGTAPGAGNIIANTSFGPGVGAYFSTSSAGYGGTDNAIRDNSIFGNAGLGIDLGDDGVTPNQQGSSAGPNNWQNYPVLASATAVAGGTQVTGTLSSTPNTAFAVDVFANDAADPSAHGQGQYYIGTISVITDSSGDASFSGTLPGSLKIGEYISTTATDPNGNTSEFSEDVPVYNPGEVPEAGTLYVLNNNDSGYGSLRQAILDANSMAGSHTIAFDIVGGGVQTIQPLSPLPAINNPVTIDGTTQPGYAGSPLIVLDGSQAGTGSAAIGLTLDAGDSTVRGLVVNQFNLVGIECYFNSGDTIQACYIGTDATGTIAEGNGDGINFSYGGGGLIGGTDSANRNLVSGNGYGIHSLDCAVTIEGNYIGTDVTGEHALANQTGVFLQYGGTNIVGGSQPGDGNLISGNENGIRLHGSGGANLVEGNLIGTDATGKTPLPNDIGVYMGDSDSGNTIGGTTPSERNVISGNSVGVYLLGSASQNVIEGNYIGTDISGTEPLGNRDVGIGIDTASDNTIGGTAPGAGNIIANSQFGQGIYVYLSNPSAGYAINDAIRGNSIFGNAGLGIDLVGFDRVIPNQQGSSAGPNNWQNYPVIVSAVEVDGGTQVTGTLSSTPNTTFEVDVYANDTEDPSGYGQGQYYLGAIQVTTNATGNASFSATVPGVAALGQYISTTATDPNGNTSEFSADVQALSAATSTSINSDYVAGTTYGQTMVLTATVTSVAGVGTPTGSIQFVVDGANIGSPVTLDDGTADLPISTLHAGSHTVAAVYTSDNVDYLDSATASPLDEQVSPAPLTITANNQSMVYGGPLPALTAIFSGFVNGDTAGSLTTQPSLSTTATAASHVSGSPYPITASGAVDPDYNISYVAGGLSVTPAALTITANNQSMVYGGPLPVLTVSFNGFVNGDSAASLTTQPSLSTTATAASHVSGYPYPITASGAVDFDYNISYVAGGLSVTPAALTITANNQSMVYGGPLPALTAIFSGFDNGDTAGSLTTQPSLSTTATAASHVSGSPYPITASGAVDPDYNISYVAGGLSVTPAALTVTANNQSMVYGGPLPALTASFTGFVNGDTTASMTAQPNLSTTATAASHVNGDPYPITASGAIDPDYNISYVAGGLSVTPAALAITANNQSMVYGGPLPALTAGFSGFVNGDTAASLTTQPSLSTTATAASHVSGSPYPITTSGAVDPDYNITYVAGGLSVTPAVLTVSANNAARLFGIANPAFSDTVTGFVNGDTQAVIIGSPSLFTPATAYSPAGNYPIIAAQGALQAGDYTFTFVNGTLTVTVSGSIYLLNPTASGALTLSGNSRIDVPGVVMVDSSSAAAIQASGNASAEAGGISVVGGEKTSGNAMLSPKPSTGIAAFGDPLSSLAAPSTLGLTNYGTESLSGRSSTTINPGVYTQISVSGNASLTMNPGTYIIEGGGMSVSGNASIAGSGVTIVNAGSDYPNTGGNYGGIAFSGNGTFNLSAPVGGPYVGITVYQTRDNTRAMSLGGNANGGLSGTVYAANALLAISGNARFDGSLVVGTLSLSGNASQAQIAAGSDSANDSCGLADTLLAGDLDVYLDNANGDFTADELARIGDAIQTWNSLLVPYSVAIVQVSDPSLANLVIDAETTSASGTADQGVLGCYNSAAGEITLLVGWNWYAGADPAGIGSDQYDFQTTATHELGHALGLGHAPDPSSPMYESLEAGIAHREVSVADLNIPDPPQGADPEMATGLADPSGSLINSLTVAAVGTGVVLPNYVPATTLAGNQQSAAEWGGLQPLATQSSTALGNQQATITAKDRVFAELGG